MANDESRETSRRRARPPAPAIALALVLSLAAAACGGDGGHRSGPDALTGSTESTDGPGPTAGGSTESTDGESADATPTTTGTADRPTSEGPTSEEPTSEEPTADGPTADGDGSPPWAPTPLTNRAEGAAVARWTVEILETRPHDPDAWTQGFEVHVGTLYESTGREGESSLRAVDIVTGDVVERLDLPDEIFAEGLTIAGDRIFQVTWKNELAYVRDLDTFATLREFGYEGQGWGICHDGTRLVMSDGTSQLAFRDPETFEVVGRVDVTIDGVPLPLLNELECVDGFVLANVLLSSSIVVIDPSTGRVAAVVEAGVLSLDAIGIAEDNRMVLNGIARVDDETFLLTGKYWPSMYLTRFVAP